MTLVDNNGNVKIELEFTIIFPANQIHTKIGHISEYSISEGLVALAPVFPK